MQKTLRALENLVRSAAIYSYVEALRSVGYSAESAHYWAGEAYSLTSDRIRCICSEVRMTIPPEVVPPRYPRPVGAAGLPDRLSS